MYFFFFFSPKLQCDQGLADVLSWQHISTGLWDSQSDTLMLWERYNI